MRFCRAIEIFVLFAALTTYGERAAARSIHGHCDGGGPELSLTPGFRPVRLFEDPANHRQWLIERNVSRPGSPGRASQVAQPSSSIDCVDSAISQVEKRSGMGKEIAIVHAGEGLLIVDETPMSRAELGAVAANNGRRGESIAARLRVGGKVVTAVVMAPGRAVLTHAGNERFR